MAFSPRDDLANGTSCPVAAQLVHELVERHARETPGAVAARFGDAALDYAELNRRANRLAHRLAALGVGAESFVVVCVEPSFDILVALLGILKAGAAYVPVDPGYPAARIQALLEDTRPAAVVTQPHLASRLEPAAAPVLVLDPSMTELPAENPRRSVSERQPAYVFYTSGTTGTPKGVVASHANLLHYVGVARERYELGPHDVMPSIARFSFSISLFELLAPLVAGGTSLILPREIVLDPPALARALSEVTIFHAGPSLLKGLVSYLRAHPESVPAFSRVRHASSGGDMVPPELLEALKATFSNAEVFVIYGSSEIACMGTTYPVPRDRTVSTTYVGKPFARVAVRVLDEAGEPVPCGVSGEIHFAGDGVALGYLNRPELTREKFVVREGRRFYRTGDRGRLNAEGELEILGRTDFQIKIRGMRVEPAEIEFTLRRAPGVRDAVVSGRAQDDGEKMLVAYVVPEYPPDPDDAAGKTQRLVAIRRYLVEQLPDYMVPAVFVELEKLPLNHNLKLDRRGLPAPTEADFRALGGPNLREPTTPTERRLAVAFGQLLKLRSVGKDDNFFELGGDSLLAVQLSLAVEEALGVRLEGMDILRESLEMLARICDRKLGQSAGAGGVTASAAARAFSEQVETFHFGPEKSLYGALRGAGRKHPETAVLICGAVGQEHVRSRFVLTKLAKTLARAGVPSLVFDYFGCGDSLGDGGDVRPGRWQGDIESARTELAVRTGAARYVAVGVRLGGLLLAATLPRLDLARVVLWDPVESGACHLEALAREHRRYLKSLAPLRLLPWPRQRPPAGEWLGTTFPEPVRRELAELSLKPLLAG
ncbi:MAG TPA: amino acid adenylation domain-containing protein, partial [Polyangiaceae bacterium]